MSQFLLELLTLLVEDAYGDLCSTVFRIIGKAERLTLPEVIQQTRLPSKRVKAALAVLVQQHLLLWNTVDGASYYEIDVRNGYNIIRYGKVAQMFEARFGKGGKQIAEHVILNGHVQIHRLIAEFERTLAYQIKQKSKRLRVASGEMGDTLDQDEHEESESHKFDGIASVHALKTLIRDLLDADYLTAERVNLYRPVSDIKDDAERIIKETLYPKGPRGTKENADFKRQVVLLKRKLRNGEMGAGDVVGSKKINSSKLNVMALQDLSKVVVESANGVNGKDDNITLNMDIVLRLNEEKICVLMRNCQLVDMARRYLGETTAKVYEALLQCLEDQIPRCYDSIEMEGLEDEPPSLPTTSSGAVLRCVDPSLNLYEGLSSESTTPALSRASSSFPEMEDLSSDGAFSRLELVRTHLQMLSEDPREFVHWSANEASAEWHVDFHQLSEALVNYEVESTIISRFSSSAGRVVRVLRDTGQLDEKQISLLGMLPCKDTRIVLNTMQEAGYVEVQEIPKENSRQTARSLWLWNFNEGRCRRVIIDDTYKTMSRVLQRLKMYRTEFSNVIEKAERANASKSAGLLMTRAEKDAVATWKMAENKLLTQLIRLDEVVAALRDFSPYNPDSYLVS